MLHEHTLILMQEPSLRATQYLPDIVKLQQCLYDSFHHRLDRTDANRLTIGEFLEKLPSGMVLELTIEILSFKLLFLQKTLGMNTGRE